MSNLVHYRIDPEHKCAEQVVDGEPQRLTKVNLWFLIRQLVGIACEIEALERLEKTEPRRL